MVVAAVHFIRKMPNYIFHIKLFITLGHNGRGGTIHTKYKLLRIEFVFLSSLDKMSHDLSGYSRSNARIQLCLTKALKTSNDKLRVTFKIDAK